MSTSQQKSKPKAVVIETRYAWGETLSDTMSMAMAMQSIGWSIEGNPAPMTWNGRYGTGVAISRISND